MLFGQLFRSRVAALVPTSASPMSLLRRTFTSTAPALREFKLVVNRRVKQRPALKGNFWVRQHLKTGRRIKYPPYPYGDATVFKRSNRGLFGGLFPMKGHSITEKLERKINRRWVPNIVKATLYSEALKTRIKIPVATKVLRTIKREGGLDNYLTKEKSARIKELGPRGWRLRYAVLLRQQNLKPSQL
ncbi:YMR193Wp-like protein [Myxozyma melibiosi]|uniref:YMR193Wp-like protein n=1 Tax=Myxozyma melibiosi TaxID=54550 RepID=A0ABR1F491_9ASCO